MDPIETVQVFKIDSKNAEEAIRAVIKEFGYVVIGVRKYKYLIGEIIYLIWGIHTNIPFRVIEESTEEEWHKMENFMLDKGYLKHSCPDKAMYLYKVIPK